AAAVLALALAIGAWTLFSTASTPSGVTAQAPALVEIDAEVQKALKSRGLKLEDAAALPDLSPLVERWRRAREKGPANARVAADALIPEVARTMLDGNVLQRKAARLEGELKRVPSSKRAALSSR